MLSYEDILEKVSPKAMTHKALWRSIPTCYPSKALYWPDELDEEAQALAAALADVTSEIDNDSRKEDRWYQYGDNEETEFCFGDAIRISPSRFTDGSYPVWYGASSQEASKVEVSYHLTRQALYELQFAKIENILIFERAMCKATVHLKSGFDMRRLAVVGHEGLNEQGPPYPFCQRLGALLRERADGLATASVRLVGAENWAVFDKKAIISSRVKNFWDLAVHRDGERRICGEYIEADGF